jgi:solute carrier family 12 sodium/potassium/chloride transporter 2
VPKKISEILKRADPESQSLKFGTFGGVFTPDTLTILGVIMYLRLGWVVGNAGLLGALTIILLAKSITICTGLSMSSITTNIKIGAGGAYSIISKSLGIEAGGSVGIPFYISQTLSASLYIVGFTEGWLLLFPYHPPMVVAVSAWAVLITISAISTHFAIKFQYIIMAIIAISLVSFFASTVVPVQSITLIGNFEDASFWQVFAVFFPAVTGIMAGANLSGDLKNPRKSIPLGTLSAIGVTLIIYVLIAVFAAYLIPMDVLRSNQMAMVDYSRIHILVILGILAATFSSALGSIIGAPRILQALAEHKTVPFHKLFELKTKKNEPRNAFLFTSVIILVALIFGSLNALATLITLFFLITYGMLNLVVFLQQSMKIISFRPTFKIPQFVSFFGAVGCIFIMFLINPIFSIVAIIIIILLYIWLTKKGLSAEWGDIRGGMFLVLAEKASRVAAKFPRHQIAWKPDLLIPIEDPKIWGGPLFFIKNICYPSGSIFAFSVKNEINGETKLSLDELMEPIKKEKILVNSTIIEDDKFLHGAKHVIQTLQGGALRPNTLFLTLGNDDAKNQVITDLTKYASDHDMGVMILKQHTRIAFGMQKDINIWLRDKSPNWHLAMLVTLQLQLNWNGKINLVTVAKNEGEKKNLQSFLERLSDQTRLPSLTEFHVVVGNFKEALVTSPRADINLFGIGKDLPFDFMREASELTKSSCLYVKDSGHESALV